MIKFCGIHRPSKSNPQLEQRIADFVREREIVLLKDLVDDLQTDASSVRGELESCVTQGKIECLKPAALDTHSPDAELTYYRWVESTDRDYLWQKELAAPATERTNRIQLHADHDLDAQDLKGHGIWHILEMLRAHILPHAS